MSQPNVFIVLAECPKCRRTIKPVLSQRDIGLADAVMMVEGGEVEPPCHGTFWVAHAAQRMHEECPGYQQAGPFTRLARAVIRKLTRRRAI